jgi:hypothetical protein
MKVCPTCREQFEDEMNFCTFDGKALSPVRQRAAARRKPAAFDGQGARVRVPAAGGYVQAGRRAGAGKLIVAAVLMAAAIVGVVAALVLLDGREARREAARSGPSAAARTEAAAPAIIPEAVKPRVLLGEMSRQDLMDLLPKNLLRRFRAGDTAQGTPDDLRVLSGEAADYVVLVGAGSVEGPRRAPTARILVLKYEEEQFRDVTRQSLPRRYAEGVVEGQRAGAEFDQASAKIILREAASSPSVVDECAKCEHAYQQVALEWKGDCYVESSRGWENDRYTAFYVAADALAKRRVDQAARPFIESSLDHLIASGFERDGESGWAVEWRSDDDEADTADYELNNGIDRLIVTVSKIKGQWKVVEITEN